MALFGNGVDKAGAELRKLQAARLKFEDRAAEAEKELADLRAGAAGRAIDQFVDGSTDAAMAARLANARVLALENERASFPAVRSEFSRRIYEALRSLGRERAAAFRKEAAQVQVELSKHLERLGELRKALEDFTEVRWVIEVTPPDAEVLTGPGGVQTILYRTPPPFPKSSKLEARISQLNAQANAAEALGTVEGGQIPASSLAELLAPVDNIEVLAPTRAAIEAWFAEVTAQANSEWQAQWAGRTLGATRVNLAGQAYVESQPAHDVIYVLRWGPDGTIDRSHSSAQNRPDFRFAA